MPLSLKYTDISLSRFSYARLEVNKYTETMASFADCNFLSFFWTVAEVVFLLTVPSLHLIMQLILLCKQCGS